MYGGLAQMVERTLSMREVLGSMPRSSIHIIIIINIIIIYTMSDLGKTRRKKNKVRMKKRTNKKNHNINLKKTIFQYFNNIIL